MNEIETFVQKWAAIVKAQGARTGILAIRDEIANAPSRFSEFQTGLRRLLEEYYLTEAEVQDVRRYIESDFGMLAAKELAETQRLAKLRRERQELEQLVFRQEAHARGISQLESIRSALVEEEKNLRRETEALDATYRDLCAEKQQLEHLKGTPGD